MSELLAKNDVSLMCENGTIQKTGTGEYAIGNMEVGNITFPSYPLYDFYHDHYHHYYPYPEAVTTTPNKTETAYKVIKALMDKGLVRFERVKTFVALMDVIVGVL